MLSVSCPKVEAQSCSVNGPVVFSPDTIYQAGLRLLPWSSSHSASWKCWTCLGVLFFHQLRRQALTITVLQNPAVSSLSAVAPSHGSALLSTGLLKMAQRAVPADLSFPQGLHNCSCCCQHAGHWQTLQIGIFLQHVLPTESASIHCSVVNLHCCCKAL